MEAGEAVYVERVEARRALRVPSAIGRGYPAHATNLGKVLLADRPAAQALRRSHCLKKGSCRSFPCCTAPTASMSCMQHLTFVQCESHVLF